MGVRLAEGLAQLVRQDGLIQGKLHVARPLVNRGCFVLREHRAKRVNSQEKTGIMDEAMHGSKTAWILYLRERALQ